MPAKEIELIIEGTLIRREVADRPEIDVQVAWPGAGQVTMTLPRDEALRLIRETDARPREGFVDIILARLLFTENGTGGTRIRVLYVASVIRPHLERILLWYEAKRKLT